MAGKFLKKSSIPGVSIQQLVEEIPEGCSTPDFKQKPVTLALQEGKNAIFRAVVCGEPTPKVHWQNTRGDLSNCSKYQVSSAPGSKEHVLQINKLAGEDSDLYRCTAVNMYGEATCSVRLTVIEVGFRKNRKRQEEPQEDLRKELMDFRKMLKKRAPPPAPEKEMESEQVWQLLMTADRKDYEQICMKYGIVDFRGMLRKLQEMKKEREDKMSQYVNAISNLRHIRVTKEGAATFDLELDLKDLGSKIYLYKDGEMIPYGFDNQTKHCLRRLGKRYHFQIQDLQPEDSGLYQVMVEDTVVFSTKLEASTIPPRVVVPLAEARCEEKGDAVFECTLSNPCPNAAWHFQHRPLRLNGKYEVFVSPDGLTHRLVVRGAHVSDRGLYSLSTGLHASSAWLVVEAGKDQGSQTTDADRQLQIPGAPASDAEGLKGGGPREQDSLEGARLASGAQLGADRGSYSSTWDEGAANSAWGPGQDKRGFLEVEQGRATCLGESQPHREGDWGGSHPGEPHLQERGLESGLGFTARRQQGQSRDGNEDRSPGKAGGWDAGSGHSQDRGPGSNREKTECRQDNSSRLDRHGQGQLWDPRLGAEAAQGSLRGAQSDAEGSWWKGRETETLQDNQEGKAEGGDGLGREKGKGATDTEWETRLGDAGVSIEAGSLGTSKVSRRKGSGSKTDMDCESWESRGGGDADCGEARGYGKSGGQHPEQSLAGNDSQKSPLFRGRRMAKAEGSPWGEGGQGLETVVEGRDYKVSFDDPGDSRDWEGSPQELPCEGDGQGMARALGRMGGDVTSPQSWRVGHREAGEPRGNESGNTDPQDGMWLGLGKTGTYFGPSAKREGESRTQAAGIMKFDQREDARNHELVISPGLGAQRSGGTLEDMEGLRGPVAVQSEPDFWDGSGSFGRKGPKDEMSFEDNVIGPGRVGSMYGVGAGCSREMGSRTGADYHDGPGQPGRAGSNHSIGCKAINGASQEAESAEGGTYRLGSGAPGEMWSGNEGHCGPGERGSRRVSSLRNASGDPHGKPTREAQNWDASRRQGQIGPRGQHCCDSGLGDSGTEESTGRGGVSEAAAVLVEGLGEAEPGSSGRIKAWGPTGDYGNFRAPGTLGGFGEGLTEDGTGLPGVRERGSLAVGSEEGDRKSIRFRGARASGAETGNWDNVKHPEAQASHAEAGSEAHGAHASSSVVGYGDGSEIPGLRGTSDGTLYGKGSRGLGPGRSGPEGEAGFKEGLRSLKRMGAAGESGCKNSTGRSGVLGLGGQTGYRNGIKDPGIGGLAGNASCDNSIEGSGVTGSWGEAGFKNSIGGSEVMGSGEKVGYKNGLGTSGMIPEGSDSGYRGDLQHAGGILSRNEAGFKDGLQGAGGAESESEVSCQGGFGEKESEGKMRSRDGLGRHGGSHSLAGPRDHKVMVPRSGCSTTTEAGASFKDGTETGRRFGLAGEPGPGVDAGMATLVYTAGSTAHGDTAMGPAVLETQGGPQIFSGGQGTKNSLGNCGPLRVSEEAGAVSSLGKPGIREWQDSSRLPGSPMDKEYPRGENGSSDQAGAVGTCRLPGVRTVQGECWTGTTALESRHGWDFNKAGSGTTDRGRVTNQGDAAPEAGGDTLLKDSMRGAGSWNSSGTGQIADSSFAPGKQAESTSGPEGRQGVNHAWVSDQEGQGRGSSRASSLLQGNDVTFSQTHEQPGGSKGKWHVPDQEAISECQGLRPLDSVSSGLRRGKVGGTEDSVPGNGNSTMWEDGVTPKPGESCPRGTQNILDGSLGGKGSGGRRGGMQDLGSQMGTGQKRGRGSVHELGSLEVEIAKVQGSRVPKKYEGQGAEDPDRPDRKPGLYESRCQAQCGTEVGPARRGAVEGARSMGCWTSHEDRGSLGESWNEDGSKGPQRHLGCRRSAKEDRSDICNQGQDATQSPRSGYKPGTRSFSTAVRGPVGHFSQDLADTEVQLGETAMLSCTLASDLGPGTWFKDGVELTAKDGVVFEQDGPVRRLIITHVEGTRAGKYTFVAGNQCSEASLTVQDPPTIALDVAEKLRKPLVVKAGKPVNMKVPFQSHLPVQAAWRKDGDEVLGSSCGGAQVTTGDGYTRLCLPSAGRKDSGQYSVTLRSKGGCVQAAFTLQVIDKPQPPQGPLEVQDFHRAGICLSWRPPRDDGGRSVEHYVVERRQAGRSTWLKVGEPPPDSTSFTDASVEQGRKYAFRVRAVTSEGAGDALESEEVLVAPEALPGSPSAPAILSSSSQSITLTWAAPHGPSSAHILGYLVEKRKKGSNTWMMVNERPMPERRCTVEDVRQGCQYEFRVTAVASSGPGAPGPPSDAVFARDPMNPPGPVRDLQVTDTSNTSITLSWKRPETQDADEAQGYVVELRSSDSLQWSPCHEGTVPGTTFTAKGLRPQEGYFLRVTAVNDGGHSQPTALDSLVHAMPATVCPKFLMDSSTKDVLMVRAGDSIRVPVSFEAVPMPEVTWLKDGLPLPRRSVTTTKNGLTQLLIPAASLSDQGRYTVLLRSLQGKEAAYSFLIGVAACPRAPGPIHLQENVPGTVTAQWEASPDEARGAPLHYAVLMRTSSHGSWREVADRVHTTRFTLLGVLSGREYHFRVVAKNDLGTSQPSDTSQPWCIPRQRDRFTVKTPTYSEPNLSQKPRFLVGLRAHLLPQGCECRMTCAVQGSPRPRVTWFKNDQSLDGNPALYSTDMLGVCSLVIPSVSPEDSGKYKAVAENPLGQASSTATLIVTEPSF